MKKIISILFLLSLISIFGQIDENGNPIFNSEQIDTIPLKDDYKLILSYYKLDNNIDNPLTSVFVSKELTNSDVIKASTELISYSILFLKGQNIIDLIAFNENPKTFYTVINQKTEKIKKYKSNLKGEISESRANEIIDMQYDENAKIENGLLYFDGKTYKIFSKDDLLQELISIIEKNNFFKHKVSDVLIPTNLQLEKYIINETKKGGVLDFFTEIEGKEFNAVQIKPGVIATLEGIAFYQWGKANYSIGVNTFKDAIEIYKKIKGKELNIKEKKYIESGFKQKWEQ